MLYAICNLSIVPLRAEPSDKSELVSQILYGEVFKVIEQRKYWSKIQLAYDTYEGWVDNKQYIEISETDFASICSQDPIMSSDLLEVVQDQQHQLTTIPLGSSLNGLELMKHHYDGKLTKATNKKDHLVSTAFLYLNAPYLWGGKTPFGIDCSGFTQMVYKLNGYHLLRDASQQSKQGQPLSFIEESEAGDLAFFDNNDGEIIHVGIIMEDNYIIHAHGKVRIDRLDHSGIYNAERNVHTHKLRVIKKII
jgi:hypothetical protein